MAFIKCRSEKAFAGTDRIGAVGDNDIKGLAGLINEIDAIVDHQLKEDKR
jgi:hypothetical protein